MSCGGRVASLEALAVVVDGGEGDVDWDVAVGVDENEELDVPVIEAVGREAQHGHERGLLGLTHRAPVLGPPGETGAKPELLYLPQDGQVQPKAEDRILAHGLRDPFALCALGVDHQAVAGADGNAGDDALADGEQIVIRGVELKDDGHAAQIDGRLHQLPDGGHAVTDQDDHVVELIAVVDLDLGEIGAEQGGPDQTEFEEQGHDGVSEWGRG